MTIKVLNEFLPNAEIQRLGAVKVGDTLEITQDEGVLNVDPTSVVSAYYSNIITEIAQDIKLELNDGILTLKAGSKVYIPNGVGKFDTVNIVTDRTPVENTLTGTFFVFASSTALFVDSTTIQSGSTFPSSATTGAKFYNAAENKMYRYNGTEWQPNGYSLPLGIVTLSSGQVTSIDQVFNGAGYIGHHAFILPRLKGMAPDGLSDKGYVKNVNIEVNKVLVYDLTSGSVTDFNNSFLFLNPVLEIACQQYITLDRAKELVHTTGLIQYAYQENKDYTWNSTTYINPINLPIVECSLKDSAVTYFRILQPLRMATVSDIKESTDSFLFDYKWADHNPNKLSWLRADTFSWKDGATYKSAYKHLVEDFNGTTSATETIGSNTITYYLATDKHKIVLPDQESIVQAIYNETGIAWYYILDTANTRFKLPRTKFGFVGIRDGVGNYIPESVPNITGHSCLKQNDNDDNPTGAFYRANSNAYTGFNSGAGHFIDFDASRSSSAYQDNAPVQQRATQMYLYCYVGRANQDALEKSEIDIVALTNSSINQITSTKNTSLTEINTATEEGINRLNTDSNALNRTQITNCITEIPQDIKLELNNGTLTLKAGSKVYVPNGKNADGSLKFDVVNIASDISGTRTSKQTCLVFVMGNSLLFLPTNLCYSGPSAPTGQQYAVWYDTTNNSVKYTSNSGSSWSGGYSLPICVATSDGSIISIDQVFNGFGYIGSTVFCLPGVKGLIPDGRNADGSLKNFKFETTTVKITSNTGSGRDIFAIDMYNNFNRVSSSAYRFNIENNTWELADGSAKRYHCVCGSTTGDITSFMPKVAFRAVDYNDFKAAKDDIMALSASKQDTITDLDTIRSGASKGATAVQPTALTEYAKDTDVVKVTGNQNIDGFKTFLKPMYSNLPYLDISIIPTSTSRQSWVNAYDKNGTQVGFLRSEWDGSLLYNTLGTVRVINNSTIYSGVLAGVSDTGSRFQLIDFPGDAGARTNQIDTVSARNNAIKAYHDSTKQDKLIAGSNIDITDNVISATGGGLGYSQITNCITEIPQDIKLELNNGTLTLKAGSKVYVPNGAGKFDVVNVSSDLTLAKSYSRFYFVFIKSNGAQSEAMPVSYCFSGNSQHTFTDPYAIWYDTANNKIKLTNNGGSTWEDGYSLPICVVVNDTTPAYGVSSIDQVFNGFGYIGSTVFALPGVKGLIPNGRNEDGSLKNIEIATSSVLTYTNPSNVSYSGSFIITNDLSLQASDQIYWKYNQQENLFKHESSFLLFCEVSFFECNLGKITSFTSKTTFHAVDYNDAVLNYGNQTIGGNKAFTGTTSLSNPNEDPTSLTPSTIYETRLEHTDKAGNVWSAISCKEGTNSRGQIATTAVGFELYNTKREERATFGIYNSGTHFLPYASEEIRKWMSYWSLFQPGSGIDIAIRNNNETYTCPADGWVAITSFSSKNSYIGGYIYNQNTNVAVTFGGQYCCGGGIMPVFKDNVIVIKNKGNNQSIDYFRFYPHFSSGSNLE